MATYQIFIEANEMPESTIGLNASYMYQDGFLRVYNKGRVVAFQEARKGEGFVIICEKGKVYLKKLVPPQKNGALVAWLLRFNKNNRATSIDEYNRILAGQRKRRDWIGYEEWEYKSEGYVFTLCNSPMDNNFRNVAGFISDAITKKEVINLIPFMVHHPDWYILKHLSERFGITEEEFRKAKENN